MKMESQRRKKKRREDASKKIEAELLISQNKIFHTMLRVRREKNIDDKTFLIIFFYIGSIGRKKD